MARENEHSVTKRPLTDREMTLLQQATEKAIDRIIMGVAIDKAISEVAQEKNIRYLGHELSVEVIEVLKHLEDD